MGFLMAFKNMPSHFHETLYWCGQFFLFILTRVLFQFCFLVLCALWHPYLLSLFFQSFTMQGSWIVRQSVGSTPCLLGKAVDCNYIRGPKYLEVKALLNSIVYDFTFRKILKLIQEHCSLTSLNFLQIDVDIGSSTVANGVLGLVCGVITTLVVDMAFLVQVCSLY